MEDIAIYFQPVTTNKQGENKQDISPTIGEIIQIHTTDNFPAMENKGVAIFYVPEYRNHLKQIENNFSNDFRSEFYSLYIGSNWKHTIYDLGTIQPGNKITDTYHAVKTVCKELIKKEIIPLIVGGTQDLTNAMYNAYEDLELLVNLSAVDFKFDVGKIEKRINHEGWLNHLLLKEPNYLFNYTNIATQIHYVHQKEVSLFNDLNFDICRLGEINDNIQVVEPYMRNSDLLSMDMTSIRAGDLQNENYTSPNGIFANEACRILRYAGISDKLTSLGIFNYYSQNNKVTDELVAQLIWYFNEGYANRKNDFPIGNKKNYTKFTVYLEELNENIVFYKSQKSGRWWIEISYSGITNSKLLRHQMVPCSYETYKEAMEGEIPDLWYKTYQKFI